MTYLVFVYMDNTLQRCDSYIYIFGVFLSQPAALYKVVNRS